MQALDMLLSGPLGGVQTAIRSAYNTRAQHCYNRHPYSQHKFADCMQNTIQEVEQLEAQLRHKLLFVGLKFDECIRTRDRNICEMEGRDHGTAAINHFIKNIERY